MTDKRRSPAQGLRPTWPRSGAVISLLACFVALVILRDWWPLLRGGFGWQWPYAAPTWLTVQRCWPAVLVIVAYAAGARWLARRPAALLLGWVVLSGCVLTIALLYVLDDPLWVLFSRTISPYAGGAFSFSLSIKSLPDTLHAWPSLMPGWRLALPHLSTSAAGWPALYFGLAQLLGKLPAASELLALPVRPYVCQNYQFMALDNAQLASAWLGIASPLWLALTAIPLYALARRAAGEGPARQAVLWWPLVPALALFGGTLNSFYPLPAMTLVFLFWDGLNRRQGWLPWAEFLLSGLLLGGLLVLNFSLLPLLLLCGLLGLFAWQGRGWFAEDASAAAPRTSKWLPAQTQGSALASLAPEAVEGPGAEPVEAPVFPINRFAAVLGVALAFGAGLALVWLIYWRAAGHTLLDVFRVGMVQHVSLGAPYVPWLVLNVWDLAVFGGLPLICLAVLGLFKLPGGKTRHLVLPVGLTFAAMLLSGTTRGEAGRIWLYWVPLWLLAAGVFLATLPSRTRLMLMASQCIWLLVVNLVFRTITTGVTSPPEYAQVAHLALSAPTQAADARFGDVLQLAGYQAQYQAASNSITLALHWRALKPMTAPYYFSAVLVGPDGKALPGQHWQPFATRYPTTCWSPAATRQQPVIDQIDLPLGAGTPQGNWWLSLSAFSLSGQNEPVSLPVQVAGSPPDVQVGLGPIAVWPH